MSNGPYLGWEKSTYEYLLLLPIYVIVGTTYTVTIAFTVLRLVAWNAERRAICKLKEADRKAIAYMLETFFNMLIHREGIRSRSLKPNKCADDGQLVAVSQGISTSAVTETSEERMRKLPVPGNTMTTEVILKSKWAVTILSWYVASVASLALAVFWDAFILKHTGGVAEEGKADCYAAGVNGTHNQDTSSPAFECYALALEFPKATAELAGILFLASNGFTFLMFLMLLVVDGIESRCCRIITYLAMATLEYFFVGSIVCAFVVRYQLLGTKSSINTLVQECLISCALIMGVTTPWLLKLWAFISEAWKNRAISISGDRSTTSECK